MVDFHMRATYISEFSKMPTNQKSVSDEFWIRLITQPPGAICFADVLTKTGEISDVLYTVGASTGPITIPAAPATTLPFTRTLSNCDVYQYLYFFDEVNNDWVDYDPSVHTFITFAYPVTRKNTANTDIGFVTIEATRSTIDPALWQPSVTYSLKLVLQDPNAVP